MEVTLSAFLIFMGIRARRVVSFMALNTAKGHKIIWNAESLRRLSTEKVIILDTISHRLG